MEGQKGGTAGRGREGGMGGMGCRLQFDDALSVYPDIAGVWLQDCVLCDPFHALRTRLCEDICVANSWRGNLKDALRLEDCCSVLHSVYELLKAPALQLLNNK